MLVGLVETNRLAERKMTHIAPTRECVPKSYSDSGQSLPVRHPSVVTPAKMSSKMRVMEYIGPSATNLSCEYLSVGILKWKSTTEYSGLEIYRLSTEFVAGVVWGSRS
jgi:hypothetical protein